MIRNRHAPPVLRVPRWAWLALLAAYAAFGLLMLWMAERPAHLGLYSW